MSKTKNKKLKKSQIAFKNVKTIPLETNVNTQENNSETSTETCLYKVNMIDASQIEIQKRCSNCKYWSCIDESLFKKDGELAAGVCHRFPPYAPVIKMIKEISVPIVDAPLYDRTPLEHPVTFAYDWCGEFSDSYVQ